MARTEHLKIQEQFVSVQGEGVLVGTPSSFIRVAGCNLRCAWCDTPRSSWAPMGEQQSVTALIAWAAKGPKHVVITGGEPLLFAATAALSKGLREAGHHVTVETSGTLANTGVCADLMSVSPKLAHSTPQRPGESQLALRHERERINIDALRGLLFTYAWQLKFVVRAHDCALLASDVAEIQQLLVNLDLDIFAQQTAVLLMPEAVDADRLRTGYANLVDVCKTTGMRLGQRLHIELFGNTPLT